MALSAASLSWAFACSLFNCATSFLQSLASQVAQEMVRKDDLHLHSTALSRLKSGEQLQFLSFVVGLVTEGKVREQQEAAITSLLRASSRLASASWREWLSPQSPTCESADVLPHANWAPCAHPKQGLQRCRLACMSCFGYHPNIDK